MQVDPWQVTTGCMTLLCSLLIWIGRTHIERINAHSKLHDSHTTRLTTMEATQLTQGALRTEIAAMEQRLTTLLTTHQHFNSERIDRLESSVDKAHDRIDRHERRQGEGP